MKYLLLVAALIVCQTNALAADKLPREFQMLPPMAISAVCGYRMNSAAERISAIESRSRERANVLVYFASLAMFWAERAVAQGAGAKDFDYWTDVADSIKDERVNEQNRYCAAAGEALIATMTESQQTALGERVADMLIKQMKRQAQD